MAGIYVLPPLALPGAHKLMTRVSALTVTLVLVIHKAISFRYHARGTYDPWFQFFSIDKNLD